MIKRIIKFILYLLSIAIMSFTFCFSYYALSNAFPVEDVNDGHNFHNLPENSIDVLVLGSSHAQYSFSPEFFYQDTGLYSYVLGTPCQPLSISYNMLKEGLKTQSPSTVVLEVFTAMPLKTGCDGVVCYIEAGFQMTGEEKYDTLRYLPEEKQEVYINPFLASHNNWVSDELTAEPIIESVKDSIKELVNDENAETEKTFSSFGFIRNYPQFPIENSWYATKLNKREDVELEKADLDALNKINKLCKKNGINLLLYKTPIDSLDDVNLSYLEKVWEWADENDIPYVDFIEKSEEIDFQLCIQSSSFHSYINGASLITRYLSDFIVNNYEDKHIYNEHIDNKLYNSSNDLTIEYLYCEYDANKYLSRLLNYKGPILIRYGSTSKPNGVLSEFLNKYDIKANSIYLYDGDELIDSSETCVGINYKEHEIYCDDSFIEIDGERNNVKGNLTVVIFDEELNSKKIMHTDTNRMWLYGFNWYDE